MCRKSGAIGAIAGWPPTGNVAMLFLKQKRFNLTTYYLLNAAELYKQFDRILILLCRRPPQCADGAISGVQG
jgi:hypothetical protein